MAEIISDEDVDNMPLCIVNNSSSSNIPDKGVALILSDTIPPKSTRHIQRFDDEVIASAGDFENCLEKRDSSRDGYQNSKCRHLGYIIFPLMLFTFFLPNDLKYPLLIITLHIIFLQRKSLWPTIFTRQEQSRALKWRVDDFPDKVKTGFLSSPIFNASGCQWRLIVKQKKTCAGTRMSKYSFGLILTNISRKFQHVTARAEFAVSNSHQDLITDLTELTFVQTFESEGDSGFSEYINFTLDPNNGILSIKCRLSILPEPIGFFTKVIALMTFSNTLNAAQKEPGQDFEVGTVVPEEEESRMLGYDKISATVGTLQDVISAFLQHPETKSFIWKIPDALEILENGGIEYWEIFSPSFVLSSNGVCSIWRLKFVEIHGILRLHLQLRGLPKRIPQVKVRYTVEIMDNFGDFVAPEQCASSAKYADYLCCWNTLRILLYSYDAFMKRFVVTSSGIHLRISIQVDPLETTIIDIESTHSDGILSKNQELRK